MKYRVYSSHCGDAPERPEIWEHESDDEALAHFKREVNHPSNAWDNMWMDKIIVVEKVKTIATSSEFRKKP